MHATILPLTPSITMALLDHMGEPPSAAEIQAFREKWNLTQAELARRLGLRSGVVTISAWENDRSTPMPYLRLALLKLDADLQAEANAIRHPPDPIEEDPRLKAQLERLEKLAQRRKGKFP